MKTGYLFECTYVQGDPTETAHREGMRRLVLSVCRELRMSDEQLAKILQEQDYE